MRAINFGRDLALLAPQLAVLLTGVLALVAQMLRRPAWSLTATMVGLAAATGFAVAVLGHETSVFAGTYRVDSLSVWAALILAPAATLSALLTYREVRGTDREGAAYSLLVFTTAGALALAGAGDMMVLVLGVLISSLGSFALVAYPRDDRATEAGMKYFVFGSVTEAIMIFGLTYWFGATGSTLLADLHHLSSAHLAAVAGIIAVVVGLGYKAAVVPFHFWAPDAYDGAPVGVAAYLSIVPKVGAIFGLAQVVTAVPSAAVNWRLLLAVLAVASMTYGNLAALQQTNVVRLLAYSSIAQAGYFLLGVVALGSGSLPVQALVLFAAAYAATNLGAFAVVAQVGRHLTDFAGAGRRAPWVGAAMVIFLLSLVGVPPLAGFVGKLLLFGAAINAGFAWLAVVAIANSVLSLAVYLRIIVPMYRGERSLLRVSSPETAVLTASLLLTILIGLGAQALIAHVG